MKPQTLLNILAAGCIIAMLTGCAHVSDVSKSDHHIRHYAAAVPPGWLVYSPNIATTPSSVQTTQESITFSAPTNSGFWASLVAPRPVIYKNYDESWFDYSKGGGTFLFTDPSASQVSISRTNQTALGGSHSVNVGSFSATVTTNDVTAIGATASGVGSIIGTTLNRAAVAK